MTSSKRRPGPLPPIEWTWSQAAGLLFEHTSPPERLLFEDLGPDAARENFEAWCMQRALRESAERLAVLLNEAGVKQEDLFHLDPNGHRDNLVAKYLEGELL